MLKGVVNGLASSISFGLIPLFTLPVLAEGMSMDSLICYRFTLATLFIAVMMLVRRESFKVSLKDLPVLVLAAVFYDVSSLFLLWAYDYLGSGIATILHFTYPILTTLVMMAFFGEKGSFAKVSAILLAVGGVVLLSLNKSSDHAISVAGVAIAVISGLGYALYMVTINVSRLKQIKGLKLTFYVFLIGNLMLFANAYILGDGVSEIPSTRSMINLLLLAFVCTVISNQTLIVAIKNIGSVMTSVFGAMEPVTAVIVGLLCFNEVVNGQSVAGMVMILAAVIVIILANARAAKGRS